jgi:membrane-associated PAP2 superfamily phosphatase
MAVWICDLLMELGSVKIKKKNKIKKMLIHKCIYVIQMLVSLACLLKSLQHIEA